MIVDHTKRVKILKKKLIIHTEIKYKYRFKYTHTHQLNFPLVEFISIGTDPVFKHCPQIFYRVEVRVFLTLFQKVNVSMLYPKQL